MTRQVLFVQGAGAGTYDEWDNKLVESLTSELGLEYEIRLPGRDHQLNNDLSEVARTITSR